MKSPTERLPRTCVLLSIGFGAFMMFVWSPVLTLWFFPWWYEGVVFGSMAFRKAYVIGSWIAFSPILAFLGILGLVVWRAFVVEERLNQAEKDKRQAKYGPVTLTAIRDDNLSNPREP